MEKIEAAYSLRREDPKSIPRENIEDLPLEKFYLEYLLPNRPVIVCGATQEWGAARDWVTAAGEPDVEPLKTNR